MRIECICSSKGAHYRLYRTSNRFEVHMRELVAILLDERFKALIGGMDNEPDVVLTVGPLDAILDAEFREHVMKHLGIVPSCVA